MSGVYKYKNFTVNCIMKRKMIGGHS